MLMPPIRVAAPARERRSRLMASPPQAGVTRPPLYSHAKWCRFQTSAQPSPPVSFRAPPLEAVRRARWVRLSRRWLVEQAAQVEEVFLRSRSLFERRALPLLDELVRCHGRAQRSPWTACSAMSKQTGLVVFRERERPEAELRCDGDELPATDLVGHGRGPPLLVDLDVPERLAAAGVEGGERAVFSPKKTTSPSVEMTPEKVCASPACG